MTGILPVIPHEKYDVHARTPEFTTCRHQRRNSNDAVPSSHHILLTVAEPGHGEGATMEANAIPARPSKVTLALYMLYLSLGISVMSVLVTWLRLGVPGPVGYWLINVLMMITIFHVQAQGPTWVWYGGLLNVAIAPIAVLLYYMIGKGKNWARITLLVLVILETLDSMLGVIAGLALSSMPGQSRLSLLPFLTSIYTLQTLLKIVAVALLFGRVSSNWFKPMKIYCPQEPGERGAGTSGKGG